MSDHEGAETPTVIDPATVKPRLGSIYPPVYQKEVAGREKRQLGNALGLKGFGVNLVTVPPGVWSTQRHWHSHEDEFVYILEGELTLVTDEGETVLTPGMAAGFPAGRENGHKMENRSDRPAVYLEVGSRLPQVDEVVYPDIDMLLVQRPEGQVLTNRAGEPY